MRRRGGGGRGAGAGGGWGGVEEEREKEEERERGWRGEKKRNSTHLSSIVMKQLKCVEFLHVI
jgi:hypothetical protein